VPIDQFSRDRSIKDGHARRCRTCTAEFRLGVALKHKYGISEDKFNLMLKEQGGVCAICENTCSINERLSVDHDHKTGKVRGLLCQACNTAIGKFNDDIERIHKAIRYLEATKPTYP
jgi:hypothetical protein